MRVLLLSMPGAFEHPPTIGMWHGNGALACLACNIDPHHEVAIAWSPAVTSPPLPPRTGRAPMAWMSSCAM